MVSRIGPADAGDPGDAGDAGDAGAVGVFLAGGGPTRPIGVSPAVHREPGEDWFRGDKWPPAEFARLWTYSKPPAYPRGAWSDFYFALAFLGEFTQAKKGSLRWDTIKLPPVPKGAALKAEIDELIQLIEYRPGLMSEALAQRDNLANYWCGILTFDSGSHPATSGLVEIARQVGQFQVMHYKRQFHRARPSMHSPALMPPIAVPGHASYPSGHATQSMLMALVLERVMPLATRVPPPAPPPPPPPPPPVYRSPLMMMAQRIARNREVLGLHFPSDSQAGRVLAQASFTLLMECKTVKQMVAEAKKEWWP